MNKFFKMNDIGETVFILKEFNNMKKWLHCPDKRMTEYNIIVHMIDGTNHYLKYNSQQELDKDYTMLLNKLNEG